jgi:hypothetical protein
MSNLLSGIQRKDLQSYIDGVVKEFEEPSEFIRYSHSRKWKNTFPNNAGAYGIYFDGDEPVYVGESGNLRKRMNDMFDSRNHVFRRSYGTQLFSDRENYRPASSRKQFPPELELDLNVEMERYVRVYCISLFFGHKEIEEHLIEHYKPRFNHRGRRG